jgi:hypothetical protein
MRNPAKRTRPDHFRFERSWFLTLLLLSLCGVSCLAMEKHDERHVVGGPCHYKSYPGQATILSVQKREGPARGNGRVGKEYEVKFSFTPADDIEEDWVRVEGKGYLLMLTNSRHPGPAFLKRYGIEPGKRFECDLKVITRGTCTPVLFDFPTIDLSDFFEGE